MSPESQLFTSKQYVNALFERDELERILKIEPVKVRDKFVAMGIFPALNWDSKFFEFNAAVLSEDKVEVVKLFTNRRGDTSPGEKTQVISVNLHDETPSNPRREIFVFNSVIRSLAHAGDIYDASKSLNPQNQLMKMMMAGVDFGHPYVEEAVIKVVPTYYPDFDLPE